MRVTLTSIDRLDSKRVGGAGEDGAHGGDHVPTGFADEAVNAGPAGGNRGAVVHS